MRVTHHPHPPGRPPPPSTTPTSTVPTDTPKLYNLAIWGGNIPAGNFLFSASTFRPFWAKMYQLGVFYFQPVHFSQIGRKCTGREVLNLSGYILAILGENVQARNISFSAGIFWPIWAKTYRLGFFSSQPVHLGHFERKCTSWAFLIPSRYILVIWGENVPPGGFSFSVATFWPFWAKMYRLRIFVVLRWYVWRILGENVRAGIFLFSTHTFRLSWVKMYWLRVFSSQPVHFGLFRRNCTGWGFLILNWYVSAMLAKIYRRGVFYYQAVHFGPFCAKMYPLGAFYSQLVYFGHFGRKCTG